MSEISPVGPGTAGIVSLPHAAGLSAAGPAGVSLNGVGHLNGPDQGAAAAPSSFARHSDRVELSDRAMALGLQASDEIRQDRVAAARLMIERGEYPTERQIEIAIERLVAKLR